LKQLNHLGLPSMEGTMVALDGRGHHKIAASIVPVTTS
jgi:hypothetical protein